MHQLLISSTSTHLLQSRASIEHHIAKETDFSLIFIESICEDPAIIARNIELKIASGNPDYANTPPDKAKKDLLRQIREHEKRYETITESHLSYLRITNAGSATISRIHGYLPSCIAFYLMNLHRKPRSIYLSRHGESQFEVEGRVGGDSLLSSRGLQYADALPGFITNIVGNTSLTVWTSTLQRAVQTVHSLPYSKLRWKALDELNAGVCDGMTYNGIEHAWPDDIMNRDGKDRFDYRFRGGESYRDVIVRLEPVIMELERQENILIIGHQAVLRCLCICIFPRLFTSRYTIH